MQPSLCLDPVPNLLKRKTKITVNSHSRKDKVQYWPYKFSLGEWSINVIIIVMTYF